MTLVTLNKRSSFGKAAALAASTTLVVNAVVISGVIATPVPTGLPEVNSAPVPSSTMVAVAEAV